jgi:hypothetical protein
LVSALQYLLKVANAGSGIDDANHKQLGRGPAFDGELDAASASVVEGVAHDLGDRGGEARLMLHVVAEERTYLACALARTHNVTLYPDLEAENGNRGIIPAASRA